MLWSIKVYYHKSAYHTFVSGFAGEGELIHQEVVNIPVEHDDEAVHYYIYYVMYNSCDNFDNSTVTVGKTFADALKKISIDPKIVKLNYFAKLLMSMKHGASYLRFIGVISE